MIPLNPRIQVPHVAPRVTMSRDPRNTSRKNKSRNIRLQKRAETKAAGGVHDGFLNNTVVEQRLRKQLNNERVEIGRRVVEWSRR